jgi:hypothetical protein
MTETPQPPEPGDTPHDDELDIEGPNESAPGHEPEPDPDDQSPDN